jgi:predicted TIM-barrel fold metal-dependent hydrolase
MHSKNSNRMKKIARRTFFSSSLKVAALASLPLSVSAEAERSLDVHDSPHSPAIVDTNVNLFQWPFRRLKYSRSADLMEKLKTHQIKEAWAGSFEALFHKDIDGVNRRLTEACESVGKNFFRPFGTVNLAWPDWMEDLRRCHEHFRMAGVRIYPSYQTSDLDHPEFLQFLQEVAKRGLILQIVGDMEDSRNHHPIVTTRNVNMEALLDAAKKVPTAKIQLLYWNHRINNNLMTRIVQESGILFDTARIETSGGLEKMISGHLWNADATPVPVERILFGSHAPYFPVEANLLKLIESPLTLAQARSIMNGNAQQLIKTVS